MAIGFFVAMSKGLFYEHMDRFKDLPPRNAPLDSVLLIKFVMVASVILSTLAVLEARRRNYRMHQRYLIRHIGCSLWVAVQRIVVCTNGFGYYTIPLTRWEQRELFVNGGALGMVVTIGCGELAIHLLEVENKEREQKQKAA